MFREKIIYEQYVLTSFVEVLYLRLSVFRRVLVVLTFLCLFDLTFFYVFRCCLVIADIVFALYALLTFFNYACYLYVF